MATTSTPMSELDAVKAVEQLKAAVAAINVQTVERLITIASSDPARLVEDWDLGCLEQVHDLLDVVWGASRLAFELDPLSASTGAVSLAEHHMGQVAYPADVAGRAVEDQLDVSDGDPFLQFRPGLLTSLTEPEHERWLAYLESLGDDSWYRVVAEATRALQPTFSDRSTGLIEALDELAGQR